MDLLTLKELSKEQIEEILCLADEMKRVPENYYETLKGKILVMLFEKTSTRTRTSFEAGMVQLGGHAIYLDWKSTQLGKAKLGDEIKCIERYADIMMARVYTHDSIIEIANASSKPVINALCDKYHPCQILADLMTIREHLGSLEGKTLAYLGDGNNVCNTLIIGCKKVGMKINVATPKGYEPSEKPDLLTTNPVEAVKDADVVYTDTWVSMGQEKESAERMKIFPPYQVNKKLLGRALFMHCLPAYRGLEVTDEVIDSKQSVVFDEAENRMHAQKALMVKLLKEWQ